MILIFSNSISSRLTYICHFIFIEQLGLPFEICTDKEKFIGFKGPKINYSTLSFDDHPEKIFNITPHTLLFEEGIKVQEINLEKKEPYPIFFKTEKEPFRFDIFAATFYLISRYEEYLPHSKDAFGRFGHESSIAFKEGFLNKPIVNYWINDFSISLKKLFPTIPIDTKKFELLLTYDIDIAYSYKAKGVLRNMGGFLLAPSWKRILVWAGKQKDPFDMYDLFDELHEKKRLQPIYFFLVPKNRGRFDKNNCPDTEMMKSLIRRHANKYSIGIHPSWKSNEHKDIVVKEKNFLADVSNTTISNSRQHFIKFELPRTYSNLLELGIVNEYSMGYGSVNGFRASVASSFLWYDLVAEKETSLRIHPFCYMDANCYFEEQLTPEQAYDELLYYYNTCREVDGTFVTIFHNNFLTEDKTFAGWRKIFLKFISQLPQ